MFKFLKDKIKEAISNISKKVEDEVFEAPKEVQKEIYIPLKKAVDKKNKTEDLSKEIITEEKKSIFKKIKEKVTLTKITKEKFEELFKDIEIALLENNVAQEIVERIKKELEKDLIDIPLKRNQITSIIKLSFKKSLEEILSLDKIDLQRIIKESNKKPYLILILGYNGVGKSLTISKIANFLKEKNLKVILAAGDTFRAAGSSQLVEYAKKIDVPVIKGKFGGDSCSIIYDAVNSAKAKNFDVVLADTAGRMHTNQDLLNELKKIIRVNKPDLNVLVIDAITGSDVVQQVEEFSKSVNIDSLIITKVDTYEKGGALLSAAYLLKKPILFLGTGQSFSDIKEFNKEEIIKSLGF